MAWVAPEHTGIALLVTRRVGWHGSLTTSPNTRRYTAAHAAGPGSGEDEQGAGQGGRGAEHGCGDG